MPTASGSIAYLGAARFQGYWNASTNAGSGSGLPGAAAGAYTGLLVSGAHGTPTNLTASAGDYWQVTGAGSINVDGHSSWNVNDWCIYSASAGGGSGTWQRLAFEDTISSIVVGDLASSSFHMGSANNKHLVFSSGSILSGSENLTFDYNNNNLLLTGTLQASGSGITLTGGEAGAVVITMNADQGDDAADTFTMTAAANGNTTLAAGADIVLDPGGNNVLPGGDSADDLGADGVAWRKLYVDDIDLNGQGRIDFDSAATTSIRASADNILKIEVGGSDIATIDANDLQFSGNIKLDDDKKLYFGQLPDAHIEYNENGDNLLVISGSAAGAVISGSTVAIASNFTDIYSTSVRLFGANLAIQDDKRITFGDASDAYIEYDEAGGDTAVLGGSDWTILDDKKLYFGTDKDAHIEYNEDGDNYLIISGSAVGTVISGSKLYFVSPDSNFVGASLAFDGTDLFLQDNKKIAFGNTADAYILYDESTSDTAILGGTDWTILDDKKLHFGTGLDSFIGYNEDGDNLLVVSGSKTGMVLSGSKVVLDSTTVTSGSIAGLGSFLAVNSTGQVVLTSSVGTVTAINNQAESRLVTLGSTTTDLDGEANLTYNGTTFVINDDARINDDLPLYFGTQNDAFIKYRETADNLLVISGSKTGMVLSGSKIVLDSTTVGSGSMAGPGSLLAVDHTGKVILTPITGTDIPVGAVDKLDSFIFLDSDGSTKQDAIGDLLTAISGDGLDVASSQLKVNLSEVIASDGNNRLLTSDGDGTATAEANLTYDGTTFNVHDDLDITGSLSGQLSGSVEFKINMKHDTTGQFSDKLGNQFLYLVPAGALRGPAINAVGGGNSGLGFATSGSAKARIFHNEEGDGFLVISGSSPNGTVLSGNLVRVPEKLAIGTDTAAAKTSGILVVQAAAADTTNGLIATFKSGDSDYCRVNIDNSTANGDTQFTFMSNGSSKWSVGNMGSNETFHIKSGFGSFADTDPFVLTTTTGLTLNTNFTSSVGGLIPDDQKLYFGDSEESHIEYNENGDNLLVISGSSAGMVLSGSTINIGGLENAFSSVTKIAGKVGINDFDPKVTFSATSNYQMVTFENQLSDGEGGGERLIYSPGANDTLTAGQIYYLHTDGTWNQADASSISGGGTQLIAVGFAGSSQQVGVLLRGFIRIPSTEILNVPGSGAVDGLAVYVSTTAGHFDFTPPSSSGEFVRAVGHAIDDDSGDVLVYFNPAPIGTAIP